MKYFSYLAAAAVFLSLTGCFPYSGLKLPQSSQTESGGNTEGSSKNGNRTFQVLEEDASIKTEDLTLKINSAGKYKQLEDYIPDDKNWRFLSVNVTIKNLFEHGAMLYLDSSDFSLTWDDLDGYTVKPEDLYITDQLPDYEQKIKIFKNTSRSGNLIFVVPAQISDFQLVYKKTALPFTATEKSTVQDYSSYNDYYGDYFGDYFGDPYGDIWDYFGNYSGGSQNAAIESVKVMETSSFRLSVNSFDIQDSVDVMTPEYGNKFLVVNVTFENTHPQAADIALGSWEFTLQDDSYVFDSPPVSKQLERQIADDFTLGGGESITGDFIYEISDETRPFSIYYYDFINDYKMYLSPPPNNTI